MKVIRLATVVAIAAAFFAFSVAGSAFAAATSFSTGFQVQNLSNATANITVSFYQSGNSSGTAVASFSDTIPANGQKTYAALNQVSGLNLPSGFTGGAVISSDQQVAAIVNVIGNGNFNYGASYSGSSAGGKSVQVPLVFKAGSNNGNFNSFFNVQNIGSSAATVTATYSGGDGPGKLNNPVTETKTIAPQTSERFDQSTNPNLPAGFNGSASVSSDQDVSVAALENGPTTLLSYSGFASFSTAPVFPLVNANNSGFITGIALSNVGTQSTDVTVTYTPTPGGSNGTACTETQTVAAKSTAFFALTAFAQSNPNENCANGAKFVGSGVVSANSTNQPLAAIVNQLNSQTNKGGAYNGFDPASGTATVVYPLIQDRFFGYFTGISIVNVGSVATPVTCTFSNSSVTQSTSSLAPGGVFTQVQQGAIANGYNGSAVCTASASGAKIVGIYNQLNPSVSTDAFFVAEGANS